MSVRGAQETTYVLPIRGNNEKTSGGAFLSLNSSCRLTLRTTERRRKATKPSRTVWYTGRSWARRSRGAAMVASKPMMKRVRVAGYRQGVVEEMGIRRRRRKECDAHRVTSQNEGRCSPRECAMSSFSMKMNPGSVVRRSPCPAKK